MESPSSHPVIFIVGPTGVGKSRLALELAQIKQGVVLNCDSLQSYRYLDIGTAKPSFEERSLLPHLLFDFVEPPQVLTAGQFRERARDEIEEHIAWGPVIAVGGSGFYIRALQSKMYELKDISTEALAKIYEIEQELGTEGLYAEMLRLDPGLQGRIHAADSYRVKRALGLMFSFSKTLTEIREQTLKDQSEQDWPYRTLKVGLELPRAELRERVRLRCEQMLSQGWINEVKQLQGRGLNHWPPLESVGYKEIVAHLRGDIAAQDLVEQITLATMRLAKKQMTWFKKDPSLHWLKASTATVEDVLNLLTQN